MSKSIWPEHISPFRFVLTGTVLEVIGNAVLYPFYFCKTHLQTNVNPTTGHGNPFVHLIKQAQQITAEHGIRGLYRGYLWSTFGSFPGIIVHVGVYTMCKYQLSYNELNSSHNLFSDLSEYDHDDNNNNDNNISNSYIPQKLIPLFSGVIAETCAAMLYVPQEVVSQRLQLAPKNEKLFDIIKAVYQEKGIRSFWRGTSAAYLTYIPSAGCWWGSYEFYKHIICKSKHKQNLLWYSLAGVCGGATTAIFTNPIDIIRTRLQTQRGSYGQTRILPLISNLYKKEGIFGFSKGVGARISLLVLEGIIFADFYEIMMYFSCIEQ